MRELRGRADAPADVEVLSLMGATHILTLLPSLLSQGKGAMLVMECMDHGSLYDLINNDTIVMEGEIVLSIMRDVMQGVLYLHSNR
jgi:serine/threonine protein kinase